MKPALAPLLSQMILFNHHHAELRTFALRYFKVPFYRGSENYNRLHPAKRRQLRKELQRP